MANTRPNKNIPTQDENPLFHDTWKLLKNYRDAVWNLELAVQQVRSTFEIEYGSSIEEFLDSMYIAGTDVGGTKLENYAKSIERSNKIRGQKHPGAAWQTGTCAGNARRRTGCLMPSGRTASSPERMPTAGCRIPSASPASRRTSVSFQTTAVTA